MRALMLTSRSFWRELARIVLEARDLGPLRMNDWLAGPDPRGLARVVGAILVQAMRDGATEVRFGFHTARVEARRNGTAIEYVSPGCFVVVDLARILARQMRRTGDLRAGKRTLGWRAHRMHLAFAEDSSEDYSLRIRIDGTIPERSGDKEGEKRTF
jgi:hypothetical protein